MSIPFILLVVFAAFGNSAWSEASAPGPSRIPLTEDERNWLVAHPQIVLGLTNSFEPMAVLGPAGEYSGFVVEIVERINRLLGSSIQVEVDNLKVIHERVASRDLDGMAVVAGPMAAKLKLLTTTPYFAVHPAVFTRHDALFQIDSMADLRGKTVSRIRGIQYPPHVFDEHEQEIVFLDCDTVLEALSAVFEHRADAMAGLSMTNYVITKEMLTGLVPAYVDQREVFLHIGIRADWPELVSILNKSITSFAPDELDGIIAKWVGRPSSQGPLLLSPKQRDWIAAHPVIRVGNEPDYAPFDFRENGKPVGYSMEYVNLLAARLGLAVEHVQDTWGNLHTKAKSQEVDLIHPIIRADPDFDQYLLFTRPFKETISVIVTDVENERVRRVADLTGLRVAYTEGDDIGDNLTNLIDPPPEMLSYATYSEAIRGVATGRADAMVVELPVANWLIRQLSLTNLKIAGEAQVQSMRDLRYRLGVRKDWPMLVSLLERAMDQVTPAEMAALEQKWMAPPFDYGWLWKILFVATGVAAVITSFFLYWNRRLATAVARRTADLNEAYELQRAMFDQTFQLIGLLAPDGTLRRANETALAFAGVTAEEVAGRPFWETPWWNHDATQQARIRDAVQRAAAGEVVRFESSHVDTNGDLHTVDFSLKPMRDANGAIISLIPEGRDITEHKAAEKALRESEAAYRDVFDSMNDGLAITGLDGRILDVNPVMCELYGYSREELLAMHAIQLLRPDYHGEFSNFVCQISETGRFQGETIDVRKDGSQMNVEVRGSVVTRHGERCLLAIIRDVTDRKRGEEELRREKDFNTALVQTSPAFFVAIDADGKTMMMNDVMASNLGYAPEEVIGTDYLRTFTPEADRQALGELFGRIMEAKEETVNENRVMARDGRLFLIEWHGCPVIGPDGKVEYFVGVGIDITERKKAEEELGRERDFSATLVHTSPAFFVAIDLDYRTMMMNEAMARSLGYTREEVVGTAYLSTFIPEVERNAVREVFCKAIEMGKETITENHLVARDGHTLLIEWHGAPVTGPHGKAEYIIGVGIDITERTRAEMERRKSEAKYRRLVESLEREYILYLHGTDGVFTYVSPSVTTVLGYSQEEFLTHYSEYFTDNPLNEEAARYSDGSIHGEQQPPYEVELHRKHGGICLLEVTESPIRDEGGAVIAVEGIAHDITERRRAEQALRLTQYSVDHSRSIMVWLDHKAHFKLVNQAICDMLGYSRDELLQMGVPDVDPFWSQEQWDEHGWPIWKSGEGPFLFESQLRRKDGNTFPVEIATTYVDFEGQEFVFAFLSDMTERKQAEAERSESEAKFRTFMDNFPGHVYIKDANLRHVFANRFTLELFNTTLEEWIDTNSRTLFPPKLAQELEESDRAVLEEGRALEKTFEIPGEKGAVEWVRDTKFPIVLPSGERMVGGIAFDITKRRKAEEALRESTADLRQAQEVGHIGSWHIDITTNKLRWSEETYRIFGVPVGTPEDYKHFLGCVHPEDKDAVNDAWSAAMRGEAYDIDHRLMVDGKTRWVHEKAEVTLDELGTPLSAVGTVQDITDRKTLEEELRQTQKMEAIGTLAGGIAHDFNNILGAVMGHTQLLQMRVESGETPDLTSLDEIMRAADRAKDLVQQILTFSRRTEAKKQPVRIDMIAKEALKLLRGGLPALIEIRQDIVSFKGTVMADATQMHQVVMNLCTNASHAMGEQGGVLTVAVRAIDLNQGATAVHASLEPGSYLELKVSDTGHGIAPENLEHIFEPFFTTKEQGEGTGLGLAVVHGIVQEHGGTITIRSEVGHGTTFQVCLPLVRDQEEAPKASSSLQNLPRGCERILVIDDEESLLTVASKMLVTLGYAVVVRNRATSAYDLVVADREHFDLILTDLMMPKMTGPELAQKLAAAGATVPMILSTGYSRRITPEKANELGFEALLRKPLKIEILAETVRRVLDGHQ